MRIVEQSLDDKLKNAAYRIAQMTDAASSALHGPRFMYEEYINSILGILRKELGIVK